VFKVTSYVNTDDVIKTREIPVIETEERRIVQDDDDIEEVRRVSVKSICGNSSILSDEDLVEYNENNQENVIDEKQIELHEIPLIEADKSFKSLSCSKEVIETKQIPTIETETKTVTYEVVKENNDSVELNDNNIVDSDKLISSQIITSHDEDTITTTQITKFVEEGIKKVVIDKQIVSTKSSSNVNLSQAVEEVLVMTSQSNDDCNYDVTKVVVQEERSPIKN